MNIRYFKDNSLICLVSLFTFLSTQPAIAAKLKSSDLVSGNNTLENSETVRQSASPGSDFNQPVERVVIELSDDQVRRMLIEELRKEVYRLMQEAFREEGIEFAHRNVTVYLPPETTQTASEKPNDESAEVSDSSEKKMMEASGAAAAIAAAQADDGAKKPKE